MAEKSRFDVEQKIAECAAENPEFREKLLADPKAAVAELLGKELPEGLNIVIHEESEDTLHFVIPPTGGELSAAEMASVTGGVCWSDSGCEDFDPIAP